MTQIACPACGSFLAVPELSSELSFSCPRCKKTLRLNRRSREAVPKPEEQPTKTEKHFKTKLPSGPAATFSQAEPIPQPALRSPSITPRTSFDAPLSNLEEDDRRPTQRQPHSNASTGGGASHSLGIASMVLGVVALLFSFIPCIGMFSMPLSGLGLLLGIIGGIVALRRSGHGIGFPIAGSAINGMALLIALLWLFLASATHDALDKSIKDTNATFQRFEDGNNNSGVQSVQDEANRGKRGERGDGNRNSGVQSTQAKKTREIAATLAVDDLVKEWHENSALFKSRYDGKWVEVYGEVERVTEGFNPIKGGLFGKREAELEFRWSGDGRLRCFFENADELLALKFKDKIAVIGRVYCGQILSLYLVESRLKRQVENRAAQVPPVNASPRSVAPQVIPLDLAEMAKDIFYDLDSIKNHYAKDEENKAKYKGKLFSFSTTSDFEIQGSKPPCILFALSFNPNPARAGQRLIVLCDLAPNSIEQVKRIKDTSRPIKLRAVFDYSSRYDFNGNRKLIFKNCEIVGIDEALSAVKEAEAKRARAEEEAKRLRQQAEEEAAARREKEAQRQAELAQKARVEAKARFALRGALQLADRGFKKEARKRYQDIIDKYPDTDAAAKAKKLLDKP